MSQVYRKYIYYTRYITFYFTYMHGKGNNIYICIYVPMLLILHYIDKGIIMQNLSLKYVRLYNIKAMDMLFSTNM